MTRPFNLTTNIVLSIHSETWSEGDVEAGETSQRSTEIESETHSVEHLKILAEDYGIDAASSSSPHDAPNVWFTSSSPRMDRAHIEKGESTYFSLHIKSIDGTPPTAIGIQRVADLIGVEFSTTLDIPAMPIAIVTSGDLGFTAVLDATPWLEGAETSEISDLIDADFAGTEGSDEIYYRALREQDVEARALAAYLISPDNQAAGFEVKLDEAETMRWLAENRAVMHAQLAPDPERPAFGYYINLDERGEFYADVRNEKGDTVFEFRAGAEDEDNLFTDGFMRDKTDLMGLKAHLIDIGILKTEDLLMDMPSFERLLEERQASPSPDFN